MEQSERGTRHESKESNKKNAEAARKKTYDPGIPEL